MLSSANIQSNSCPSSEQVPYATHVIIRALKLLRLCINGMQNTACCFAPFSDIVELTADFKFRFQKDGKFGAQ